MLGGGSRLAPGILLLTFRRTVPPQVQPGAATHTYEVSPSGQPPTNRSTARRFWSGIRWAYIMVITRVLCPRSSLMASSGSPWMANHEAKVCLSVWKQTLCLGSVTPLLNSNKSTNCLNCWLARLYLDPCCLGCTKGELVLLYLRAALRCAPGGAGRLTGYTSSRPRHSDALSPSTGNDLPFCRKCSTITCTKPLHKTAEEADGGVSKIRQ